jgi:hypothetical protein
MARMVETGAFYGQILDAGCLMLDNYQYTNGEFQPHPVSSLPGRSSERAKTEAGSGTM